MTSTPVCATCTPCYMVMPDGRTFDMSWCPPTINSATIVQPSSPAGSSFTWYDYALWSGAVLVVVLALVATVVIVLKKKGVLGSAKHSRLAGSPDPALPPESK
jgi:hypothetical protein